MNGDFYMLWIRNRLIPAFQRQFPGKKMILVLDNASYHKPRDDPFQGVRSFNKAKLIHTLELIGVNSLSETTSGYTRTFNRRTWETNRNSGGPGNELMLRRILVHLDQHPELTRTIIQREFDRHHYQLIYTPPYNSATQPIEMVCWIVKGYVRQQFRGHRTMYELTVQTRHGFYNVLTLAQIRGCIENVKKYCMMYIQSNIEEGSDILHIGGDLEVNNPQAEGEDEEELDDINADDEQDDGDDVE